MLDFGMDSSNELYDFCIKTIWVWIARVLFGDLFGSIF